MQNQKILIPRVDSNYKQVIIVKTGEPLTKQELCINTATVCVRAAEKARVDNPKVYDKWIKGGYMKVVLKAGMNEFIDLTIALEHVDNMIFESIPKYVCIGPDRSDRIDNITGHLKLM